jgi:tetratricopeptide (TPR) repeat protein
MKKYIFALIVLGLLGSLSLALFLMTKNDTTQGNFVRRAITPVISQSVTPTPSVDVKTPPAMYVIPSASHVGQTFNNCGPASLSMALSYFGVNVTQDELREQMRPFNNPAGGNDDKSVFAPEFVEYAQKYGMQSIARPNGTTELLKKLVANDVPVVLRTWLHPNEDIGHFRIVRGYNDARGVFIQDDSYEGRNLEYSYSTFEEMWKPFNYGYILVYSLEKEAVVRAIIGEDMDEKAAYTNAKERAEKGVAANPNSGYDLFNLSTAYFHLGDAQKSVEYYERAQNSTIPARMMWYQYEPLEAYLQTGDYERVFALTDWIIGNNNTAFSEMYILRGKAYQAQGNTLAARTEFEKAVYYNKNQTIAQEAVNSL